MSWSYRIMRHTDDTGRWYAIHQVHLDDAGAVDGWLDEPVMLIGDTPEDLRDEVAAIAEVLEGKPVLAWKNGVVVEKGDTNVN